MDLLAQCELLHRQENYQTIIRLLEAIPEEERTPEQDLELARAYNNQADPCTPEGRALLQRALLCWNSTGTLLGRITAGISAWAMPTTTWIRRSRPGLLPAGPGAPSG